MRLGKLLTLGLALASNLVASPAHAVTGLEWQWPEGVTRRFVARSDVQLGEAVEFNAVENVDAYATRVKLALLLSCTATGPAGKTGWYLRCEIDDASVSAMPTPGTQGRVTAIAEEWAATYRDQAWIEFILTRDGALRSFDLEGVDKRIRRMQSIGEVMRQMALRALAPLNVQLPKKGDERGMGQWVQRDSIALTLPSNQGTLGNAPITHTLTAAPTDGDSISTIVSHGEGVLATAEELNETARNTYAMKLDGSARFDRAAGTLLESQFYAEGRTTSSSIQSEARIASGYIQTTFMQLLPEGDAPPSLPPSVELPIE